MILGGLCRTSGGCLRLLLRLLMLMQLLMLLMLLRLLLLLLFWFVQRPKG